MSKAYDIELAKVRTADLKASVVRILPECAAGHERTLMDVLAALADMAVILDKEGVTDGSQARY